MDVSHWEMDIKVRRRRKEGREGRIRTSSGNGDIQEMRATRRDQVK